MFLRHYIAPIVDFVLGVLVGLVFLAFVAIFEVVDLEDFGIFFGVVFVVDFVVDLGVDFVLFVGDFSLASGNVLYSPNKESLALILLPKSPSSSWNVSFALSSSFISCFISLISCRFPKSISFVIESTCASNWDFIPSTSLVSLLISSSLSSVSFASFMLLFSARKNFTKSTIACGSLSGPRKITATTKMIRISKKPIPNILHKSF